MHTLYNVQGLRQNWFITYNCTEPTKVDLQRLSEQQRSKVASGQLSLRELLEFAELATVPRVPATTTSSFFALSTVQFVYIGWILACSYTKKDTPTGALEAL